MIGKTLAHYEITSQLGKGGMGEVYQAKDHKLGRDVAIKVLPEEFAKDTDRVARFQREAKLLASLNHPNIAAIHGLEESGGTNFLVLELVKGETLADQIKRGPIPVEESLKLALQIAEALESAHEKGVIHRDLKPANIKVTPEGKVKVLDFGLAKAHAGEQAELNLSNSPTLSEAATQQGVILGTAAYMSPEQAKGKAVDKRTDIWAFGVVLYEMLTGQRLFAGESVSDTLAAVLKEEPDLEKAPLQVKQLLRSCLEKNPSRRLRDIGDAWQLLEVVPETSSESPSAKRPWFAWSIALICFICVLLLGYFYIRRAPSMVPDMRLEVTTPPTPDPISLALSPDGRHLAYVASVKGQQQLWLRSLDALTAQPLTATEGAEGPFWSPDSQSIAFFADSKIKRIHITGGASQVLASAPNWFGGTWSRDGVIVFVPSWPSPLYRIPSSGGEPVAITQLDPPHHTAHLFPHFLPDGRHFLFFADGMDNGIYLGSLDSKEIKRLVSADSSAVYAPPGFLLYMRQNTLFAQRFDEKRRVIAGDEIPIADSVAYYDKLGAFSLSETGILAYRTAGGVHRRRLAWFDRNGNEISGLGKPDENDLHNPEISPDEKYVAVNRTVEKNTNVWLIEAARGITNRFTSGDFIDGLPIWSPDGSRIVFCSDRKGSYDIYQKASSGAGKEELLLESSLFKAPLDWSPDGRFLLFYQSSPKTSYDLYVLPFFGKREPFPFVNTAFDEHNGQFSPDGSCVAYESNESGRYEIHVQPFPGPGRKWQISTGGGIMPRWHPNGRELFFIAPDGKLMAAPIKCSDQRVDIGVPVELFQTRILYGGKPMRQKHQYSVSKNGQCFLINMAIEESTASPIAIVTNWVRGFEK